MHLLAIDEVLHQAGADERLSEAYPVADQHTVEALENPKRAPKSVLAEVGERKAAGLAGREAALLVPQQVELVAVELEQRAQVDLVGCPRLLLARGQDLDQP